MVESLYPVPGGVGTGRGEDRQAKVFSDGSVGGGVSLTPPRGRAEGREAYDLITGPTPDDITRRAGSQAQQVIYGNGWRPGSAPELFQMWLDKASSWPSGASQACRQGEEEEEGWRNPAGGGGAPAEIIIGPGLLPSWDLLISTMLIKDFPAGLPQDQAS